MASFTVASVPYVNAIPLTHALEDSNGRVAITYAVPSRLPALLESGEADAILVSSVDALRTPGRRLAAGVCIGSDGPVKSVRLFSKVPPSEIRSLAWDASSMTSNRLAMVVLHDRYGVRPRETVTLPPDLRSMLEVVDACVLIGDIGMTTDGTGLHVLDLGEEWRELTGKPFVWAGWIGGERLTPELAAELQNASHQVAVGRERAALPLTEAEHAARERLIADTATRSGWTEAMVRDYYLNVMVYAMDARMLEGLHEFQRRLVANGFEDARHFPEIVG
jgi:chorismate dehydratase